MSAPKNLHPCPRCDRLNPARYTEKHATHTFDWYVCGTESCRMAYRTMSDCAGSNRRVVARSKAEPDKKEPLSLSIPSPCCGTYGRVKMSWQEGGQRKRRHQCTSCGEPFVSITEGDSTTVMKRFKSAAVENA